MVLHILVESLTTVVPYCQSLQQFERGIKLVVLIVRAHEAGSFCFLVDGAARPADRHQHL